jgi:hypothetical protein
MPNAPGLYSIAEKIFLTSILPYNIVIKSLFYLNCYQEHLAASRGRV